MSEFLNPQDQLETIKELYSNSNIAAADFDLKVLFSQLEPMEKVANLRHWATAERGVDATAFDKAHHAWRIQERLDGYPENVSEFVDLFCRKHSVRIGFDGRITASGLGREPDFASLAGDIYLTGAELHLPIALRTRDVIDAALSRWQRTQRDNLTDAACAAIITTTPPAVDGQWQQLAQAFGDAEKQSHNYTIRVLQSAVWQIKRKLLNDSQYPVTDHLMPVLTGPQGCGKSTFWHKFFAPLADFVYPADFKQLRDSKNFDLWRHPIVFFDEMAHAGKADIDEVKNAITSTTRTSRLHHSHNAANIRNAATFFGATNGTLGSIIYDKTGLRRFGPIATKHAPHRAAAGVEVVDWQAINSIDFMALWLSVDHKAGHPLMSDAAACAEWRTLIEGERAIDSAEGFVRDFTANKRKYMLDDLFELYHSYCIANNEKELSKRVFARRLNELADSPDFPFIAGKTNGRPTWTPKTVPSNIVPIPLKTSRTA